MASYKDNIELNSNKDTLIIDNSKILSKAYEQSDNRYNDQHAGPFLIHMISNDFRVNLGNLHLMKIGKMLNKYISTNVTLKKISKTTIQLKCENYEQANMLTENNEISNKLNWFTFIPNFAVYKTGIIRNVFSELTESEIYDNIVLNNPNIEIKKIERMSRWDNNNKVTIPTNSIKITILGNTLPSYVYLFFVKLAIKPFVDKVLKCFHCKRFGHTKSQCRGHFRCGNCSGEHNEETCTDKTLCGNCHGPHKSLDPSCPLFKYMALIRRITAYISCTKNYARKLIKLNKFTNEVEIENHFDSRAKSDTSNLLSDWIDLYYSRHNNNHHRKIIEYDSTLLNCEGVNSEKDIVEINPNEFSNGDGPMIMDDILNCADIGDNVDACQIQYDRDCLDGEASQDFDRICSLDAGAGDSMLNNDNIENIEPPEDINQNIIVNISNQDVNSTFINTHNSNQLYLEGVSQSYNKNTDELQQVQTPKDIIIKSEKVTQNTKSFLPKSTQKTIIKRSKRNVCDKSSLSSLPTKLLKKEIVSEIVNN
ncbi:uncharacterized protein [Prorops nasuta]|uniref:uncharacterized protein n=1 Tax=Prorops nasuta TaxID=863751 RepID=UPI0034CFD6A6